MSDNDAQWTFPRQNGTKKYPKKSYKGKRSMPRLPSSSQGSPSLSEPPEGSTVQLQSRVSVRNIMKASKEEASKASQPPKYLTEKPQEDHHTYSQPEQLQTVYAVDNLNEIPVNETAVAALASSNALIPRRLIITLPPRLRTPATRNRSSASMIDKSVGASISQSSSLIEGFPTANLPDPPQSPPFPVSSESSDFLLSKRRRPVNELSRADSRPSKRPKPAELQPLPGTIQRQNGSCISRLYKDTKRCTACISKKTGEPCRFRDIRAFLVSEGGTPTGYPIFAGVPLAPAREPPTPPRFSDVWYHQPGRSQVQHIKTSAARILLPILIKERGCLKGRESQVIRRTREVEVRVTCDCCATSVFSSSFLCTECGREFCLECFASLMSPDRALNQGLVRCGYARNGYTSHGFADFLPVSRLPIGEIDANIAEMERLLANVVDSQPEVDTGVLMLEIIDSRASLLEQKEVELDLCEQECFETAEEQGIDWNRYDKRTKMEGSTFFASLEIPSFSSTSNPPLDTPTQPSTTPQEGSVLPLISTTPGSSSTFSTLTPLSSNSSVSSPIAQSITLLPPPEIKGIPSDPAGIESLPIHSFHHNELTDDVFQFLWKGGETMVVTDLLQRMSIKWTPEYFIEHYGEEVCAITDCDTNRVDHTDVRSFFQQFGDYSSRGGAILKLKDWPPTADFKMTFPALFDDFHRAVPAPNYTRRDGFYNISAHFPLNAVVPDMGPKMYNAFKSKEAGYGSTRLHMDMADAVNIMLYSTPLPGESVGYAVWDIYPSSSSGQIRTFLKEEFPLETCEVKYVDPIHSQYFYLTPVLRRKLFDKYRIQSWRIYQKPGDAVFIPAGCAHQVCNLADCIKVAVDFVSPENLFRCGQLTKEFRSENEMYTWKEDILQLSNMCWSAWENTLQMEKSMESAEQ